jgi:hypothetical protein
VSYHILNDVNRSLFQNCISAFVALLYKHDISCLAKHESLNITLPFSRLTYPTKFHSLCIRLWYPKLSPLTWYRDLQLNCALYCNLFVFLLPQPWKQMPVFHLITYHPLSSYIFSTTCRPFQMFSPFNVTLNCFDASIKYMWFCFFIFRSDVMHSAYHLSQYDEDFWDVTLHWLVNSYWGFEDTLPPKSR